MSMEMRLRLMRSLILVEEEQDIVLTGTSDYLSNCLHTVYKVFTD